MILWGVIIGMLTFALLAGGIVYFNLRYQKQILQKQNELHKKESEHRLDLLKNTIEITENERRRIAGDLHDEIGSHLSTIRMLLNGFKSKSGNHQDIERLSDESKLLMDNTISRVRTISHNLHPPGLEKFGLIVTLEDLCQTIQTSTSLVIDFTVTDNFPTLKKETELALYRVAQELITNSLKHADAHHISISMKHSPTTIHFLFSDDGNGFDPQLLLDKKGLGLLNIESRILALNGKCNFKAALRQGFSAEIEIPG